MEGSHLVGRRSKAVMFQPIWTCEKQGDSLLYKLSGRWNKKKLGAKGCWFSLYFCSNKRFSSVLSQLGLIALPLLCSPLPLLLLMPGSATCRPFHRLLDTRSELKSLTPPLQMQLAPLPARRSFASARNCHLWCSQWSPPSSNHGTSCSKIVVPAVPGFTKLPPQTIAAVHVSKVARFSPPPENIRGLWNAPDFHEISTKPSYGNQGQLVNQCSFVRGALARAISVLKIQISPKYVSSNHHKSPPSPSGHPQNWEKPHETTNHISSTWGSMYPA